VISGGIVTPSMEAELKQAEALAGTQIAGGTFALEQPQEVAESPPARAVKSGVKG
jgi:hypothetical protein